MSMELMAFRSFQEDDAFSCISGLIKKLDRQKGSANGEVSRYCDCVAKMAASAERYGLTGNIWQSWLALLFAQCENAFSLAQERRPPLSGTLKSLALEDLGIISRYFNFDLNEIDVALGVTAFSRFGSYVPFSVSGVSGERTTGTVIQSLADQMRAGVSPEGLYRTLTTFYGFNGAGKYALNKAFRWDADACDIVPITHTEDILLTDIVGYEKQKKILAGNTISFLGDRPANNVLLYGESGTGKSSSIKALLNENAGRGLRMIEIYKHQIQDFNTIIDMIRGRNYKFVLFMDDLSFEQFEVEYKFLKSFIEGGLEKRPANILIYATSNRRHLMKESWSDRTDKADDMHESETMQEKMSLVDRFGLMIRYLSPEQEEYLNIVKTLARSYGVIMPEEELINGAIRWELRHGGFSGRCARQYVEHLAGSI